MLLVRTEYVSTVDDEAALRWLIAWRAHAGAAHPVHLPLSARPYCSRAKHLAAEKRLLNVAWQCFHWSHARKYSLELNGKSKAHPVLAVVHDTRISPSRSVSARCTCLTGTESLCCPCWKKLLCLHSHACWG